MLRFLGNDMPEGIDHLSDLFRVPCHISTSFPPNKAISHSYLVCFAYRSSTDNDQESHRPNSPTSSRENPKPLNRRAPRLAVLRLLSLSSFQKHTSIIIIIYVEKKSFFFFINDLIMKNHRSKSER
jgi:hypothetical protein